jgi:hypothetical protein
MVCALLCASPAHSQTNAFDISFDTAGLSRTDAYTLEFVLSQGDPSTADSTVTIGAVDFDGGPAFGGVASAPDIVTDGDVSGNLTSGVTLGTTGGTFLDESDFSENVTVGSSLSFVVNATGIQTAASAANPDEFAIYLFDATTGATQIVTNAPDGSDALATITGPAAGVDANDTGQGDTATNAGTGVSTTSPGTFTTDVQELPEASSLLGLGLPIAVLGIAAVRRRRLAHATIA